MDTDSKSMTGSQDSCRWTCVVGPAAPRALSVPKPACPARLAGPHQGPLVGRSSFPGLVPSTGAALELWTKGRRLRQHPSGWHRHHATSRLASNSCWMGLRPRTIPSLSLFLLHSTPSSSPRFLVPYPHSHPDLIPFFLYFSPFPSQCSRWISSPSPASRRLNPVCCTLGFAPHPTHPSYPISNEASSDSWTLASLPLPSSETSSTAIPHLPAVLLSEPDLLSPHACTFRQSHLCSPRYPLRITERQSKAAVLQHHFDFTQYLVLEQEQDLTGHNSVPETGPLVDSPCPNYHIANQFRLNHPSSPRKIFRI